MAFSVAANVVAVPVIFALGLFYKQGIEPWLASIAYKGQKLAGTWTVKFYLDQARTQPYNHERKVTLYLKQKGHKLYGKSVHAKITDDTPGLPIREYEISGTIKDSLVHLWGTEAATIGLVAAVLQLRSDGRTLEGYWTYYQPRENTVLSRPCSIEMR